MSIGTIETIIGRIKVATVLSPIAVFKELDNDQNWILNAVFADTVKTQDKINGSGIGHVGTFNRTMDMFEVRSVLRAAVSD